MVEKKGKVRYKNTKEWMQNIVFSYLEKYPNLPALTLSKLIYKENSNVFKSIENIRGYIRVYRKSPKNNNIKNKDYFDKKEQPKNPFVLPAERSAPWSTWILPTSCKKVLILSDIHVPFSDYKAVKTAIEYGIKYNVDAVFLNGDIMDCAELSDHEKNPNERVSFADELEDTKELLKYLRFEFKGKPIYYIPGNHENRLERFLMRKAPELLGVAEFRLDVLLKMGEMGIEYIPHGSKCYMGKLLVEHGDKLKGSGGVNPARTALLKFKRPVVVGHFHRTNAVNDRVYDGEHRMAWSLGCLCNLEPAYMQANEWCHGFAIVDIEENGKFTVSNKIIIDGTVH